MYVSPFILSLYKVRCLLQRVSQASVSIARVQKAAIAGGLLLFAGIHKNDTEADIRFIAGKVAKLRIFGDAAGKMNFSLGEVGGEILIVSQFTLHAAYEKGTRPSFLEAAPPPVAIPLYEMFISLLEEAFPGRIQTGTFGADMQVALVNDGPVTLMLDSTTRT